MYFATWNARFFCWASAEGAKGRDRVAAEREKEVIESEWTRKLMASEWWGERSRACWGVGEVDQGGQMSRFNKEEEEDEVKEYVCMCVCMHACMYVCTYIYTNTYVYIYIGIVY